MRKRRRDLVTVVGLLLEAASYLQRGIGADIESKTGLPLPWFETMTRLSRSEPGGVRMNDMAAQVAFPASSFSRLVDGMEADGLVERLPDPTNRRATLLQLTEEGENRLAEALKVHDPSARARFTDLLSDGELDALEVITRKIRDANSADAAAAARRRVNY